jgi:hypothetical protein
MGIFANALMEDSGLSDPWSSSSTEEALLEIKRKLNVLDTNDRDDYFYEFLSRKLTLQDGRYIWLQGIHSALVYWKPSQS